MSDRAFTTIFGPVSSRRLGRSLGVDIIPRKLCTLDCVYCEVGRTDRRGFARKEYVPADLILRELKEALILHTDLSCVTYSGSGEPTLHSRLGDLLRTTHTLTPLPVAVLTNGTLLWKEEVRNELLHADIVCPSLNAVSEDIFRRINRPHPRLNAPLVLDGLAAFREVFHGKYFLEILFVRGLNDSDDEVEALREACERIRPDRIDINTVVRPPAETWAHPVAYDRLMEIRNILGPTAEILVRHDVGCLGPPHPVDDDEIIAMLSRRPMPLTEIAESLATDSHLVQPHLQSLVSRGAIQAVLHDGEEYFVALRDAHPN